MFYTWVFLIYVGTHSVREQKWCIVIHHTVRLTEFFRHIFEYLCKYMKMCRKNSFNRTVNLLNQTAPKIYDFVHVLNHILINTSFQTCTKSYILIFNSNLNLMINSNINWLSCKRLLVQHLLLTYFPTLTLSVLMMNLKELLQFMVT